MWHMTATIMDEHSILVETLIECCLKCPHGCPHSVLQKKLSQLSPCGNLIALQTSAHTMSIFDLVRQRITSWNHSAWCTLAWHPSSTHLAYTKRIRGRGNVTRGEIYKLSNSSHSSHRHLQPYMWSASGQFIACSVLYADTYAHFSSFAQQKVLNVYTDSIALTLPRVCSKFGMLFSPDSLSIAALCCDAASCVIEIWHLASAAQSCSIRYEAESFRPIAWSPDSDFLAILQLSAADVHQESDMAKLHVHDAPSGMHLGTIKCDQELLAATWHPSQSSLFLQHAAGITVVSFAPLVVGD